MFLIHICNSLQIFSVISTELANLQCKLSSIFLVIAIRTSAFSNDSFPLIFRSLFRLKLIITLSI